MDNFDEFLNALGISPQTQESDTSVVSGEAAHTPASPTTLSDSDFNDILSEIGFEEVQDADAEEIFDDEEEEEVGNTSSGEVMIQAYENSPYLEEAMNAVSEANRDLDAEEDADWQEAIDSGRITPVEFNPASVSDQEFHLRTFDEGPVIAPIQQEAEPQEETEEPPAPLIPPNSPTILLDESTSRFSGTEWYEEIQKQRIILAGLGGIGSWTALQLARMTPESLTLYDDDMVEIANMSGQLYAASNAGSSKADAITGTIHAFTSMRNVWAINARFTENSEPGDIMICGFDNMEARKTFYLKWQEHVGQKPEEERKNCLYLDGRLSIDTLQVFCITGDDTYNMERYCQNYLFSDSEADETVCSMKQTTYLACMISSVIVNLFTNFVANLLNPIIPYDLPFFTEYDAKNMIFKTEN